MGKFVLPGWGDVSLYTLDCKIISGQTLNIYVDLPSSAITDKP